jgi:hypothetical protein
MRLLKSILRQTVDLLFLGCTIAILVMYLMGKLDYAAFWLAGCAIYVAGNIFNKARHAIWIEDNKLKP